MHGRILNLPTSLSICIFDVNGVLIDSNQANARAVAAAFTRDPQRQERIVRLYLQLTGVDRGSKLRRIQQQVIGRPFGEGEFEQRWETFSRLGRQAMIEAPVLPGAMEVLGALGARGITRVALSNTPLPELHEVLAALSLDRCLDLIRGGGDWPKSESLMRFLEEGHLARQDCLFFGDGRGDLAAARSAGIEFVAIDRSTGEFQGEEGIHGPYRDLLEWGKRAMDL
jgi:phosphoglycolate phosphatase